MKLLRGILGIFCLGGAVLPNQGAAALAQITLLCAAALLGGSRLHAQPALNRVLELDGDGSYVELPANLLTNLNEVTVEGWVNWASFQLASRFFDFGGGPFQLNVQNRGGTSTLWFESPEGRTYRAVTLPDQLRTNEWFHIAAVRSPAGLQLVVNGFLLPTVPQSQDVTEPQGKQNLLGRSNNRTQFGDEDFHGRMAEVRVWGQALTEAQIRTNVLGRLTGKEPGLLALYNFADSAQPGRDATGHGHDGKLVGKARIVVAQFPGSTSTASLEKVLQLDGTGGYVELPPDVFNDFTEATVEAWVKWNAFGNRYQRIFNYGAGGRDFGLTTFTGTSTLWFVIGDPSAGLQIAKVENTLHAGEWTHVAAVAGGGGMKLYLNGALVATHPYTGCFKSLGAGNASRLGQTVTANVLLQEPGCRQRQPAWADRYRQCGRHAIRWRTGRGARVEGGALGGTNPREPLEATDRQRAGAGGAVEFRRPGRSGPRCVAQSSPWEIDGQSADRHGATSGFDLHRPG